MPWFSYHGGHSGEFCRHAKGNLEDVVRGAIDAGFTHYGLSEHCPRYRAVDLFPDEDGLAPDDLIASFERYMSEAKRLQAKYRDQIDLLVAFETERLPPASWETTMRQLREKFSPDYIIGSVHDVDGVCIDYSPEYTQKAIIECGSVESLHIKYFDAVADLVSNLRPEIVGHIDLIRKFDGPEASFSATVHKAIDRALDAVEAAGAVLDVNPGAFRRGYSPVYPLPEILEKSQKMGIGVTLGDDGHGPHNVGDGLDACMEAIRLSGYKEVQYLEHNGDSVVWKCAPTSLVKPE